MTNYPYLTRIIKEYQSMTFGTDIVVFSDSPKDLGPRVKIIVGVPYKNPYAFPFVHKQLFADHQNEYDLFIYSEDDVLIQERNIEAFLEATAVLPENEIAGFLNTELAPDGNLYFCNVSSHFHWDPNSVHSRGQYVTAYFTNEHSASFMLTQGHLRRAIDSGGFLVGPHEGKYELRESAATDPYTQCGFKKVICVSHLDLFLIRHLPTIKYANRPFAARGEVERQIQVLLQGSKNGQRRSLLFEPETKVLHAQWSKDYYELCRPELTSLIPNCARTVLSIGCGWGAPERWLIERGAQVIAVPMDPIIGACARTRGIEIIDSDLPTAIESLSHARFDCILMPNVLHLVPEPVDTLSSVVKLLAPRGVIIASVPNFFFLPILKRRLRGDYALRDLGNYEKTGFHLTTHRVMRKWFHQSHLELVKVANVVPNRAQWAYRFSLKTAAGLLAEEFFAVGCRVTN